MASATKVGSDSSATLESVQILSTSVQQLIQQLQPEPPLKTTGISVLLLDVENIKLNINAETFLASICKYPLQVKIAFANWRNNAVSKHDTELYERGYQLIHVPGGKDSADAKMIAIGACILRPYPAVKEVFVCSGDGIVTHLCNELQNQGLTVYWVRRQAQILQVENRETGEINEYSLTMETQIPSLEELVYKFEKLIKTEQKSIHERLSNLSAVAELFQERCNLTVNGNLSNSPIVAEKELIQPQSTQSSAENLSQADTISTPSAMVINSQQVLEKVVIEIIKSMTIELGQAYVAVPKVTTELHRLSGQSANSIVKKLKLGANFTKFLESCSKFKLNKSGKEYQVAIA